VHCPLHFEGEYTHAAQGYDVSQHSHVARYRHRARYCL